MASTLLICLVCDAFSSHCSRADLKRWERVWKTRFDVRPLTSDLTSSTHLAHGDLDLRGLLVGDHHGQLGPELVQVSRVPLDLNADRPEHGLLGLG